MKEPIEELFKQSLKGHEMPYNPDAWKAMNARLDAVSPVTTPTSYTRYYLGAAGIGVAAIATYFFFANGNTTKSTVDPVAKETRIEQTSNTAVKSNSTKGAQKATTSDTQNSDIMKVTETNDADIMKTQTADIMKSNNDANPSSTPSSNFSDKGSTQKQGATDPSNSNPGADQHSIGKKPIDEVMTATNQVIELPAMKDICLNEEVTITNPNRTKIYILNGLGTVIQTIPAKKSVVFKPSVVGNYSLGYTDDTMYSRIESASNFQVNRIPDADFMVDLVNKYENGMPSTHVEAISGQGTYIWKADKQSATGIETDLHFYKKGNQTIELTVNNGQCSSTIEKTVFIEKDYNLLAVTGFTPMGNDPKTNTFMPFGLTQRDVNFTLTIIDGRDGGMVYQTSDATLPWDGTDIRSGRRSETPQVYVWKVTIANPAANEPSEYVGTITMN